MGVACAIGDTAWDSMYSRHIDNGRTGKTWAMYHMYAGYAAAAGIVIGSFFAGIYDFAPVFVVGGMMSFVSGAIAIFGIK